MTLLVECLDSAQVGFACGREDSNGVFQFRMHNVSSTGQLDLAKRRRVPLSAHKSINSFLVEPGDVLFNCTNGIGAVGKSLIAPVLDEPAVFSNHFLRLRAKASHLDSEYLWRWLQLQYERGVPQGLARQWVNQATVSREDLLELDIPLPSLSSQRRMCEILGRADLMCRTSRILSNRLLELRTAIFWKMFGDPVSNDRGLPQATIGSVADVVTGNSPARGDVSNFGESIEWIKSGDLGWEEASRAQEWLSDQGRIGARTAPEGSILVTCIAGSPNSIGKSSMVSREVAFNQQINAILPSVRIEPLFLFAQLKMAPSLVRAQSTGGMKGLVTKSSFQAVKVLLPGRCEQREFAELARSVSAQRSVALRRLEAAQDLFGSLQHRAFRGEL